MKIFDERLKISDINKVKPGEDIFLVSAGGIKSYVSKLEVHQIVLKFNVGLFFIEYNEAGDEWKLASLNDYNVILNDYNAHAAFLNEKDAIAYCDYLITTSKQAIAIAEMKEIARKAGINFRIE